jgi:hypothetical protein
MCTPDDQGVPLQNTTSQFPSNFVSEDDEHKLHILRSYQELLDDEEYDDKPQEAHIASQNGGKDNTHGPTVEPNQASRLSRQATAVAQHELPHSSVRRVTMPAQDVPPRMLSPELLAELAQNGSLFVVFDIDIHHGFDLIHDSLSEALKKNIIIPTELPITHSSPSPMSTRTNPAREMSSSLPRWRDFAQEASGRQYLSVSPVVMQQEAPGRSDQLQIVIPQPTFSGRFVSSRKDNETLDSPACTSGDANINDDSGCKTVQGSPVLPELTFRNTSQGFSAVFEKAEGDPKVLVEGMPGVFRTSKGLCSSPHDKCREECTTRVRDLLDPVQEGSHVADGKGTVLNQPQPGVPKLSAGGLDVIVRPNPWVERARDLGKPLPTSMKPYSPPTTRLLSPPKTPKVQTPPSTQTTLRRAQYSCLPPAVPTAPRRERVPIAKGSLGPFPSTGMPSMERLSKKASSKSGSRDRPMVPPTRVLCESQRGLAPASNSAHLTDTAAVADLNPHQAASTELADSFPLPPSHIPFPLLATDCGHSVAAKVLRSLETGPANRHPTAASLGISASSSVDFSRVPRSTLHRFHQADASKPWYSLPNNSQVKTTTSLGLFRAPSLDSLRHTRSQHAARHKGRNPAAYTGPNHTPPGGMFAVNSKAVNTTAITRIPGNPGNAHQPSPPSPVQWPVLRGGSEDSVPEPLEITKRSTSETSSESSGTPVLPNSKTLVSSPFLNAQPSVPDAFSTTRLRKATSTPEFGSRTAEVLCVPSCTPNSTSSSHPITARFHSASVPKVPSTGAHIGARYSNVPTRDLDRLSLIVERDEADSEEAVFGTPNTDSARNREAQLKFLRDTIDQLLPRHQLELDAIYKGKLTIHLIQFSPKLILHPDIDAIRSVTVVHPTVPHIVITDWDLQNTQDSHIPNNESPDDINTMGNAISKIHDGSSKLIAEFKTKPTNSTEKNATANNEQPVSGSAAQPSASGSARIKRPLPSGPICPFEDPLDPLAIDHPVRHGYPQPDNMEARSRQLEARNHAQDVRSGARGLSLTAPSIPTPSFFGVYAEERLIHGLVSSLSPPDNSRAAAPSRGPPSRPSSRGSAREQTTMPLSGQEFQESTEEVFTQYEFRRLSRIMENHEDEDIAIRWDANLKRMSQQGTQAETQQPTEPQAESSRSQQVSMAEPSGSQQVPPAESSQSQQIPNTTARPSPYGRGRTATGDSVGSGSIVRPASPSDVFTSETRRSNLLYSATAGGASAVASERHQALNTGSSSQFGHHEINAASTPAGPSLSPPTGPGRLHTSVAALDTPTNTAYQQHRRHERLLDAVGEIRNIYQTDPYATGRVIRHLLAMYDIPEHDPAAQRTAAPQRRAAREQVAASTAAPAAPASPSGEPPNLEQGAWMRSSSSGGSIESDQLGERDATSRIERGRRRQQRVTRQTSM